MTRRRNSLTRFRLRQALMWHLDRWVHRDALVDVIWGDQEDGGPLMAYNVLAINIMRLRREGYVIESRWGHGWRLRRGPEVVDERGAPRDPGAAAWFRAHPEPPASAKENQHA